MIKRGWKTKRKVKAVSYKYLTGALFIRIGGSFTRILLLIYILLFDAKNDY
jgi:hypothetical protein